MIRGIDVTLYTRKETGRDAFGAPVCEAVPEIVHNVLVGQPSAEDVVQELRLSGRRLAYTLALPKGDAHDWTGAVVAFFGQKFCVYGDVVQGMEHLIPLSWNKQVKVERYGEAEA